MPETRTFAFNQSKSKATNRGTRVVAAPGIGQFRLQAPDLQGGVCAAYACHYLQGRLLDQRDLLNHLQRQDIFKTIDENESQALVIKGKRTNVKSLAPLAELFELEGAVVSLPKVPLSPGLMNELVSLRAGEGLLFSFYVPSLKGAHACAAYHSRGMRGLGLVGTHLYLFDPNYGEFKGSANELGALLHNSYKGAQLMQKLVVRRREKVAPA